MSRPEDAVKGLGNVIVIGGCGLLGHHIVKFLLENGAPASSISVFDISIKNNRFDHINYIAGDLASKGDLTAAFLSTKPNVIINVASPDAMTPDKSVFPRCNIIGVQNIIDCAQEQGIRVLVHSSSSEVIQDSYHDMIYATEEWPVLDNPVNGSIYAKTKAVGEGLVLAANGQKGLYTTVIRLCTIFGEGDVVITRHFIELGKTGRIKFQVGEGKNLYDLIYAGNAAEGHLLAAQVRILVPPAR
jgi:sterol-4alpha-carboxylate 3-dehydrogenase (decarboxylating)